jgi:hypothetical protein
MNETINQHAHFAKLTRYAGVPVTASATSMRSVANTMKKREVTGAPRHTREATGKLIF